MFEVIGRHRAPFDISAHLQEWLAVGLCTAPADRPRAEAGVRALYEFAGHPPPAAFLWLDSPMDGAIAAAALTGSAAAGRGLWRDMRHRFGNDRFVWERRSRSFRARLGERQEDRVPGLLRQLVHDLLEGEIENISVPVARRVVEGLHGYSGSPEAEGRLEARVDGLVEALERTGVTVLADRALLRLRAQFAIEDWLGRRCDRQPLHEHDSDFAERLGVILGMHDACRFVPSGAHPGGAGMWRTDGDAAGEEIARSAGWWWPLERVAIVSERPTKLCRDDLGRLHDPEGPALLYPDGWGVWAINGVPVPRKVVEAPRSILPGAIMAEPDDSVREVMLNRFRGLSGARACLAFVKACNPVPFSVTDITAKMRPAALALWRARHGDTPVECRLYRASVDHGEAVAVLTVVCTSTAQETAIRVPPDIRRASRARDWTFDADLTEAFET